MDKNEKSCGKSLDEHIVSLVAAMKIAGMGGGCIEVYQALVEVAQFLQANHVFQVYEPTSRLAYLLFSSRQEQKLNPANAS